METGGKGENPENAPSKVKDEDEVYMDRHMGIMRATGAIVNTVIGAGIFLHPVAVARSIGSVGLTLIMWCISGGISILHGMVYCELGTMMPKAGGEYLFVEEAYGQMVAFSTQFATRLFAAPASFVIMGRVAVQYLFSLLFPQCSVPYILQQLAIPLIALPLAYINYRSIYFASRIQALFSMSKSLILLAIAVIGVVMMAQGHVDNFNPKTSFVDTRWDLGSLAVAAMFGFGPYGGWENLFYMQEEVKNPRRNLPIVCISSMVVITLLYVAVNMAYFSVMTVEELVASPGVALTFAERTIGPYAWVIALCVFLSITGFLNTAILAGSRVIFGMSRQGSLPRFLGMLHSERRSPLPAITYMVIVGHLYIPVTNIYDIIAYRQFINRIGDIIGASTWFYFRWKRPNAKRPFKIPFVIPMVVCLFMTAMLVLAITRSPVVYGLGLGVYLACFPIYLLNKEVLSRSSSFRKTMGTFTLSIQKLMRVVPEHRSEPDSEVQ